MLKIGVRSHDYGKDTPENLFLKIANDRFEAVMLAYQKAIHIIREGLEPKYAEEEVHLLNSIIT